MYVYCKKSERNGECGIYSIKIWISGIHSNIYSLYDLSEAHFQFVKQK